MIRKVVYNFLEMVTPTFILPLREGGEGKTEQQQIK
jgi:hypothetical protein